MIETADTPIEDPKEPFGTQPPPQCNHVHVKYGACIRWYDHPGGHYWERAPRPWWLIALYIALAIAAAWWIGSTAHGQTQITPRQIRGLAILTVMQCAGVTGTNTVTNPDGTTTTVTSDCTGLYYVDLVRADGTELKVIGTAPAAGVTIDPAHWSAIP